MEDIVFLGGFFPKDVLREITKKSKGVIQNAANNFQWAFINGLDQNLGQNISIFNR